MIARHVEPPTSQTWADEDLIAYALYRYADYLKWCERQLDYEIDRQLSGPPEGCNSPEGQS